MSHSQSQQQPCRPQPVDPKMKPVKSGNVLAGKPIHPEDASLMQAAEGLVMGHTQKSGPAVDRDALTIGEALEASALTAGEKPIYQSDAAAIQAAEMRATGRNVVIPRGIGAAAQLAATANTKIIYDSDKTTLADVLSDATKKMVGDKAATREDAVGIVGTEIRNNPRMETHPGGVAASVATAANLNLVKDPNVEESGMQAAEYLAAFR